MGLILLCGSVVGVVVVFGGLWRLELPGLRHKHARGRVVVLDAVRYATSGAILLIGLWVVPRSTLSLVLAALALALFVVPEDLLLRIGGIEPRWELRALQDEAGKLTRGYLPLRQPESRQSLEHAIGRMEALKAPEVAEMRDLLVADFKDSLAGTYRPGCLGLRAIRIYQIERQLFGAEARPPELDPAEATFRWRLFRAFGDMIDCGSALREPAHLARLKELMGELEQYRRADTTVFLDALQKSARTWLESSTPAPWPPEEGVRGLGPTIEKSYQELWPHKAVFWGAELDDRDMGDLPAAAAGSRQAVT